MLSQGPDDGGIPEILSTMIGRIGVTAILLGVSRVVVGLEVGVQSELFTMDLRADCLTQIKFIRIPRRLARVRPSTNSVMKDPPRPRF